MNEGFFECEFVATAKSGKARTRVLQRAGRCGQNRITVKCLCESAFVLAHPQTSSEGFAPFAGGVLTPVTALGQALVGRLAKAGIRFEIA